MKEKERKKPSARAKRNENNRNMHENRKFAEQKWWWIRINQRIIIQLVIITVPFKMVKVSIITRTTMRQINVSNNTRQVFTLSTRFRVSFEVFIRLVEMRFVRFIVFSRWTVKCSIRTATAAKMKLLREFSSKKMWFWRKSMKLKFFSPLVFRNNCDVAVKRRNVSLSKMSSYEPVYVAHASYKHCKIIHWQNIGHP